MSDFNFAAARVAAAQICRSVGLERSVPSVLDELTDVLIRYLMLLGSTARDASESRGDSNASADDAMLAAVECCVLHGGLASTELSRNGNNSPAAGIEDILELSSWLRGSTNRRIMSVARPQRQIHSSIASAQGAALAALPSSAAAASQFSPINIPLPLNTAYHQDQQVLPQKELQEQQQQQQQQQKQQQEGSLVTSENAKSYPLPPRHLFLNDFSDTERQQDWLTSALNRQTLMGHHDWFVNTELGKHTDPDPTIYGK